MWTASQRATLIMLVIVFAAALLAWSLFNRQFVPDPPPAEPPRMNELADAIDPNVAPLNELVILPQLGEKRAAQIIAYREKFAAEHAGDVAFKRAEDLAAVKGIGAATVEAMRPHLRFPATGPTTR